MQGKNIVVIGGSHGIGLAIVRRCLAQGGNVFAFSRTEGHSPEESNLQHRTLDILTDEVDPALFPDEIHGLVYCPGSIQLGPLRSVKLDTMRGDFELNVLGAVKVMQAAAKGLRGASHASVVMFSTVAVQTGMAMHTSIAAAKGAIEGLTRTWAAELSPQTRVNCIAPALTATPLSERLLATDEKQKSMAAMYPLGRYGQPDDIAAAAEYLLSDTSTWVTGQVIPVDGGLSSIHK